MKKILTIFTLCLLLGQYSTAQTTPPNQGAQASVSPTQSASLAEASKLNAQVITLFGEGKYAEALPLASRVVEIREQILKPGNPFITSSLINLASIKAGLDKIDEAERLYRRVLDILETAGRGETEQSAIVNYQLALLRFKKRDYEQTDVLLQKVVAIREKVLGPESPALVHTLLNIGQIHLSNEGLRVSRAYYVRAMSILLKTPPHRDDVAAAALKNLLCPLASAGDTSTPEQVKLVLERLENPEAVIEREKNRATQGDAGGENKILEGDILKGRALIKPQPEYPDEAKRSRVVGAVVVQIVVDEKGKVIKAEAICGHKLLRAASESAARGARFSPTLLAGQPVKVTGMITYNFVLQLR